MERNEQFEHLGEPRPLAKMNPHNSEPRFAYPSDCPKSLILRLLEIAKDTATVFGQEAARGGVLITDAQIQYHVASICAGLTVAAHDTLHRHEKLLADPEIKRWLEANPQTPE